MMRFVIVFFLVFFSCFAARKEYGNWIKNPYTGCYTRQEILLTNFITIKERVSKCKIEGTWEDFFTGKILTDLSIIDIDHVLSVSEYDKTCRVRLPDDATLEERELEKKSLKAFFNDRENLVITSNKENQRKSNKSKDEYAPLIKDEKRREAYIEKYDRIFKKYNCRVL